MKKDDKAVEVVKEYDRLFGSRENWDSHWEECARYILPRKEDDIYKSGSPGEKRGNVLIYDSTAPHANELLASALHGMLTNATLKWAELTTGDAALDNMKPVREWLQNAENVIHRSLENSNFHTEVHEYYIDLGCFGTGTVFIEEDKEQDLNFKAAPVWDSFIEEDHKGDINCVYRRLSLTGRQILDKFDEKELDPELVEKLEKKETEKYEVIHRIKPYNGDDKLKKDKKFTIDSVYVIKKWCKVLEDDGYREKPFIAGRWTKTSDEVYGRSPGMKSLPDIKMINRMKATTIRSAEKTIDPPLLVPDDSVFGPVNVNPGGLTYYRSGSTDRIEPLQTGSRIDFGYQAIADIQVAIRQAFFIDQLQLNEGPQMTATEVRQRTQEKLRLLGPILARQQHEFLRPLIDRVFGILYRKGRFGEVPPELEGRLISVRYSSQIAKAQRTSESDNLNLALGSIAPLIEMDPGIMDNIDGDIALKDALRTFGVNEKILRSDDERDNMREQRAQLQQQQLAMQMQEQQANIDRADEGAV